MKLFLQVPFALQVYGPVRDLHKLDSKVLLGWAMTRRTWDLDI